jgi:hypothetical protein
MPRCWATGAGRASVGASAAACCRQIRSCKSSAQRAAPAHSGAGAAGIRLCRQRGRRSWPREAFRCSSHARHQVDLFPEVHPTLELLANQYRLGVITNGNADVAGWAWLIISSLPFAPKSWASASPIHSHSRRRSAARRRRCCRPRCISATTRRRHCRGPGRRVAGDLVQSAGPWDWRAARPMRSPASPNCRKCSQSGRTAASGLRSRSATKKPASSELANVRSSDGATTVFAVRLLRWVGYHIGCRLPAPCRRGRETLPSPWPRRRAPSAWPRSKAILLQRRPPYLGLGLAARLNFLGELRVGFQAAFGQVHAFVLLLLADPDAHDGLEDAPDDQAGDRTPRRRW